MRIHDQSRRILLLPITLAMITCASSLLASDNELNLTRVNPPAAPGSLAPATSLAPDGRSVLLSWLELVDTETQDNTRQERPHYRLRFSRFQEESWSDPLTIVEHVPFFANWADTPSILQVDDGRLFAHWLEKSGEGTFAYDVRIASSNDDGMTWTHIGAAHNDGTQTEHGFVSLVPEADGIRAFWLDGREMAIDDDADDEGHGSGNMNLRSALVSDRVTRGIRLDERICECCGTSAITTRTGPVIFYRDRSMDEVRDIWMVRYDGMEWTAPEPVHVDGWIIPGCPVNGPASASLGTNIAVAWYTAANSLPQIRVAFSKDEGKTFQKPFILDDGQPLGRVDVVLTPDGDAIVSWLDSGSLFGAILARRISPDGRMSPTISLTSSSIQRSSGFPRLTRLQNTLLLVWTEDEPALQVRAAWFNLDQFPRIMDEIAPIAD
ncbi:MAG: sialidase family protein [Planctomycetota bacterium]|nr:sialidase family protein [Planctomycetota bacterium]